MSLGGSEMSKYNAYHVDIDVWRPLVVHTLVIQYTKKVKYKRVSDYNLVNIASVATLFSYFSVNPKRYILLVCNVHKRTKSLTLDRA